MSFTWFDWLKDTSWAFPPWAFPLVAKYGSSYGGGWFVLPLHMGKCQSGGSWGGGLMS